MILDTNKWVPLERQMQVGRRKPGVVSYRGRIYVVGGMGKDKDLNCVQILNPVTEDWDEVLQEYTTAKANEATKTDEDNESHKCNNFIYVPPLQELCGELFIINDGIHFVI